MPQPFRRQRLLLLASGLGCALGLALLVATRDGIHKPTSAASSDPPQVQATQEDSTIDAASIRKRSLSTPGGTDENAQFLPAKPFSRIPSH